MAAAIPAGGRIIGQVVRGAVNIEKVRKAIGAVPRDKAEEADCSREADETQCDACLLKEGALLPSKPRRSIRRENITNWVYQIHVANLKASPEKFGFCDKDTGAPVTNFNMSLIGKLLSRVKGEPTADLAQLNITEWLYNGVWFDGFWRDLCTVVDAKGRYQKFLAEDGRPKHGFPRNFLFPSFTTQALSQISAVSSGFPRSRIEWHFMERATYQYAMTLIPKPITAHHTPLPPIEA